MTQASIEMGSSNSGFAQGRLWRSKIWAALLASTLAACGGGNVDPCGINPNCVAAGGSGSGGAGGASGGTAAAAAAAADMTLTLSSASVLNGGADTVEARVIAVDANRNLLAAVPVTFTVDNNATAAVASKVTDASGAITARIGVGADRSNRAITVTATSGSITRTATLRVTGARITATPLPGVLAAGAQGSVRFQLVDVNANPISEQPISVKGAGAEVSGKTDGDGRFLYSYTAPAAPDGSAITISAESPNVPAVSVAVQVTSAPAPAPRTPPVSTASISLSSSVLPVNLGGTRNLVEVRALFLRDGNAPAAGLRVRFDLDGDRNSVGGTLADSSVLFYTDATGVARTTYTAGSRTSPLNGVTIRACWDYDLDPVACTNSTRATLTVVAEPLSVAVGTNNLITFGPTGIDYQKSYLVQVNDASGAPKGDVQVSATVELMGYYTGSWVLEGLDWKRRTTNGGILCENEDLNRNSASDVLAGGLVEDANRNGRLDPVKADVLVSIVGAGRTNAAGQAVLNLNYLQNVASWVEFRVSVSAGSVGGSEGRASFTGILSVLDEHVTSQDRIKPPPPPAFVVSPYNVTGAVPTVVPLPSGGAAVMCKLP